MHSSTRPGAQKPFNCRKNNHCFLCIKQLPCLRIPREESLCMYAALYTSACSNRYHLPFRKLMQVQENLCYCWSCDSVAFNSHWRHFRCAGWLRMGEGGTGSFRITSPPGCVPGRTTPGCSRKCMCVSGGSLTYLFPSHWHSMTGGRVGQVVWMPARVRVQLCPCA